MKEEDSDFLHYDEHSLDREWQRQAYLYHKYAVMLADARNKVAEAKQALDLEEAEIARDVRNVPGKYGLEKVTEGTVSEAVRVQVSYQDAVTALNKARHAQDVVQAIVDALNHKKPAMENAVKLLLADYFSKPNVREEEFPDARDRLQQTKSSTAGFRGAGEKINARHK